MRYGLAYALSSRFEPYSLECVPPKRRLIPIQIQNEPPVFTQSDVYESPGVDTAVPEHAKEMGACVRGYIE
jgi:hypothetical protein